MKSTATLLVIFLLALAFPAMAQNVGINGDGSLPDPSAMLDIKSSGKGILIPRVALTGTNDLTTIPSPKTSLLVYNTATAGSGSTSVEPGFYYWTGSAWTKILSGNMPSGGWSLTGNAGTTPGTQFIGTTDNTSLQFKVNNKLAGHIDLAHLNTFFGYQSGLNLTNGYGNTGFGQNALVNVTTGFDNIGFGEGSLLALTTGVNNVAVGKFALSNNNAAGNAAVGNSALRDNATGIENAAMGTFALWNITDGNFNSALGFGARTALNNQSNATVIGNRAYANCNNCLILGSIAGVNDAINSVNVGIGTSNPAYKLDVNGDMQVSTIHQALTTGEKIILFPTAADVHYGIGITNNLMQIHTDSDGSDVAFGYGSSASFTEKVRIKGNGRIGIGTNNPEASLDVARTTATTANFHGTDFISHFMFGVEEHTYLRGGKAGSMVIINDFVGAGNVGVGTSSPGYKLDVNGTIRCISLIQSSDARLKTNINTLSESITGLYKLNGYRYQWKDTAMGSSIQFGLLAQEVQQVFPELVSTDSKGQLGVNYVGLIPVLVEAVKELKKENEELKKLKEEVDALKAMIRHTVN